MTSSKLAAECEGAVYTKATLIITATTALLMPPIFYSLIFCFIACSKRWYTLRQSARQPRQQLKEKGVQKKLGCIIRWIIQEKQSPIRSTKKWIWPFERQGLFSSIPSSTATECLEFAQKLICVARKLAGFSPFPAVQVNDNDSMIYWVKRRQKKSNSRKTRRYRTFFIRTSDRSTVFMTSVIYKTQADGE